MIRPPRPDFLIVGAPKAGTTALHAALAQHPEVFVTRPKEPKYWLCDGAPPPAWRGPGDAHSQQEWIWRHDEYAALFTPAPPDAVRGESTPFYLWSRGAHRRIARVAARRTPDRRGARPGRPRLLELDAPVVRRPRADRRLRGRLRPPGRAGAGRVGAVLALPRARDVRRAARPPARSTSTPSGSSCCATATSSTTRRRPSTGPAAFLGITPGMVATIPRDNSRSYVPPGWRPTVLGPAIRAGARPRPVRAAARSGAGPASRWWRGCGPATAPRPRLAPEQRERLVRALRRRRRPAVRAQRAGLLRLALAEPKGSFEERRAWRSGGDRRRRSHSTVVDVVEAR